MQLYFDFSGYTDMALGLSLCFGIRLPENFNSPYLAVSVTDFWRRWHISLSGWFRDYVYIPLGGQPLLQGAAGPEPFCRLGASPASGTGQTGRFWHGGCGSSYC